MRPEMVYSYVRDLVERMTGIRPEPDADGDLPIPYEGANYYIRVTGNDAIVQVFAVALDEVESTPELHAELNQINVDIHFGRAFLVRQQVLIEHEIWGSDINPSNLDYACRMVASAADTFGRNLAEKFGGVPVFEASKKDGYRTGSQGESMYRMPLGFQSPADLAQIPSV